MLRLIQCPSDKEVWKSALRECFEWQKKWQEGYFYVIVPETMKLQYEQRFLENYSHESLMLADVLSFRKLCRLILQSVAYDFSGYVTDELQILYLRDAIQKATKDLNKEDLFERKFFEQDLNLIHDLLNVIKDLQRENLNFTELHNSLKLKYNVGSFSALTYKKLSCLLKVYEEYINLLESNNLLDDSILIQEAVNVLEKFKQKTLTSFQMKQLSYLYTLHVQILGFAGSRNFTKQEYNFLRALAKICPDLNIYFHCDSWNDEYLRLSSFEDIISKMDKLDPFYYAKTVILFLILFAKQDSVEYELINISQSLSLENLYALKTVNRFSVSSADDSVNNIVGSIYYKLFNKECSVNDMAIVVDVDSDICQKLRNSFDFLHLPYYCEHKIALKNDKLFVFLKDLSDFYYDFKNKRKTIALLKNQYLNLSEEVVWDFENYLLQRYWENNAELSYLFDNFIADKKSVNPNYIIHKEVEIKHFYRILQILDDNRNDKFLNVRLNLVIAQLLSLWEALRIEYNTQNLIEKLLRFGDEEAAVRLNKTYNTLMDILENLLNVKSENEYNFSSFINLLLDMVNNSFKESIPNRKNEIYLGNFEQVIVLERRYLYILNVAYETFPLSVEDEGYLNSLNREELINFINTSHKHGDYFLLSDKRKAFLSKSFYYRRLLLEKVVELNLYFKNNEIFKFNFGLSFLENDNLKFLSRYPDIPQISSQSIKENCDFRLYSPLYFNTYLLSNNTSTVEIIEKVDYQHLQEFLINEDPNGKHMNISVTKLETYLACPYLYFVKYILKLQDRKIYAENSLIKGTLYHLLLEYFLNYKSEFLQNYLNHKSRETTEFEVQNLIINLVKEQQYKFLSDLYFTNLYNQRAKLRYIRRTFCRLLPEILSFYDKNEQIPYLSELNLTRLYRDKGEDYKLADYPYQLISKVDNIAVSKEFVDGNTEHVVFSIYDYKTGDKKIDFYKILAAYDLQLAVYANLISDKEHEVSLSAADDSNLINFLASVKSKKISLSNLVYISKLAKNQAEYNSFLNINNISSAEKEEIFKNLVQYNRSLVDLLVSKIQKAKFPLVLPYENDKTLFLNDLRFLRSLRPENYWHDIRVSPEKSFFTYKDKLKIEKEKAEVFLDAKFLEELIKNHREKDQNYGRL